MTEAKRAAAADQFVRAVLRWHHTLERAPDDAVPMCSCRLSALNCPINGAAQDLGLLAPLPAERPAESVAGSVSPWAAGSVEGSDRAVESDGERGRYPVGIGGLS